MMRLQLGHVVVIGGGFVGQLFQLSIPSARIFDWRKVPPRHHLDTRMGPQYLWEPIPGVESHSFEVTTLVDGKPPTEDAILAYKRKIGKEHDGGNWGLQFQHKTVGWHSALPKPNIEFDRRVVKVHLSPHCLDMADGSIIEYDVLINTIPLDAFLELCSPQPVYHFPFKNDPIHMTRIEADEATDGMTLNYLSAPENPFYRQTWSGNMIYKETLDEKAVPVGILTTRLKPGKIHTHIESELILQQLRIFHVYGFGRFATWRPDELAHDTWKHIDAWKGTL